MPFDLEQFLREALARIDDEKAREALDKRFTDLEERIPSFNLRSLADALANASDDELQALEGTVLEGLIREAPNDGNGDPAPEPQPTPDPAPDPPSRKRTREGRKSGQAYDWDIDDDGQIIALKIPKVYTGEDESDRVELADVVAGNDE